MASGGELALFDLASSGPGRTLGELVEGLEQKFGAIVRNVAEKGNDTQFGALFLRGLATGHRLGSGGAK